MDLRSGLATWALNKSRNFGRKLGCELVVENTPHSLNTSMEVPSRTERAWDPELWKHGQLFQAGHANPVKPVTVRNIPTGELNEADVQAETEKIVVDGEEKTQHVELVTSELYNEYQDNHLASEIINPTSRWKTVILMIAGLIVVAILSLMLNAHIAGVF